MIRKSGFHGFGDFVISELRIGGYEEMGTRGSEEIGIGEIKKMCSLYELSTTLHNFLDFSLDRVRTSVDCSNLHSVNFEVISSSVQEHCAPPPI